MSGNYIKSLLDLETDLDTKCNQLLNDIKTYKEDIILDILDTPIEVTEENEKEVRVLITLVEYFAIEEYNIERLCNIVGELSTEEIFMSHKRDHIARLKTFLFAPPIFRIRNVYFDLHGLTRV